MIKKVRDLSPGEEIYDGGIPVLVESVLNQHGGQTVIHHSNGRMIRDPNTKILIIDPPEAAIEALEEIARGGDE